MISLHHRELASVAPQSQRKISTQVTCVLASLQISVRSWDLYTLYTPLRKYPFYAIDRPDVFFSVKCDQNVIRRKYTAYSKTNRQYSLKLHGNLEQAAISNYRSCMESLLLCDWACVVILATVHWFSSTAIGMNWKFHMSEKSWSLNIITYMIKYLTLDSVIP